MHQCVSEWYVNYSSSNQSQWILVSGSETISRALPIPLTMHMRVSITFHLSMWVCLCSPCAYCLEIPPPIFHHFLVFALTTIKRHYCHADVGGKWREIFFLLFYHAVTSFFAVLWMCLLLWNLLSLTENNKTFFELLFSYCCSFIALFCYFFLGMSQGFGVIILGVLFLKNICEFLLIFQRCLKSLPNLKKLPIV